MKINENYLLENMSAEELAEVIRLKVSIIEAEDAGLCGYAQALRTTLSKLMVYHAKTATARA